jgi:hypothetical protein
LSASAKNPTAAIIRLPPLKEKMKDACAALSLANLCFITAWFSILYDADSYYNKLPVKLPTLLALLANIFLLTCVLWIVFRLQRRFQSRILILLLDLGFLILLLIPANFVRTQIFQIWDYQVIAFFKQPVVMLCTLVFFALMVWKHGRVARVARMMAAILVPLAFFTVVKTVLLCLGVIHLQQQVSEPVLPSPTAVREGGPRVLWIVFDSADYRMIFGERPAGESLPEFDRLRNESVSAANACTPNSTTVTSMPSLISGQCVARTGKLYLSDLEVTLADTDATTTWKKLPSVFAEAQALGVNTALVGWYHPYARVLGDGLNYCSWYPFPAYEADRAPTFGISMRMQIGCMFSTPHIRHIFLSVCQDSLRDSLSVATNNIYGLALFHLPPPHTPGIYLPDKNQFSYWPMTRVTGYLNNLVLADHELGQIRRVMETSGQWDKTWLIVSADHSWQQASDYDGKIDFRVPFIIKPPGAAEPATYSPKINTILTHDLILAILRGNVTNAQNLVSWLDANGKPIPTIVSGKIDN